MNSKNCRTLTAGLVMGAALMGGTAAGSGVAAADRPSPKVPEAVCGFYPVGMYRHCDGGTGSRVGLDVRDIFGFIHYKCVGPGITDLQPGIRWRVVDAWWNGVVGCL